jgi:elongation factor Ts
MYDICVHIAAANPRYVFRKSMPLDVICNKKEIMGAQMHDRPQRPIDKIVEDQRDNSLNQIAYWSNPFSRVQKMNDYIKAVIAMTGENARVSCFGRFQIGKYKSAESAARIGYLLIGRKN